MKILWIFAICLLPFAFCLSVGRADGGVIEGLVTFPGETPPRAIFANRKDPECPRGIAQNHLEVRQENRGLHNVLVLLEAEGSHPARSLQARLQARGCMLVPRVQWAPLGSSLQLANEDEADHRINVFLKDLSVFDVSLTQGQSGLPAGRPVRRPLVRKGFYRINCDRHPWERAWVYASDHPYVAVTDAAGRFQISDVPPGLYRLRAWHEGWWERTKDARERIEFHPMEETQFVKIQPGQTTSVRFDSLEPTLEVH